MLKSVFYFPSNMETQKKTHLIILLLVITLIIYGISKWKEPETPRRNASRCLITAEVRGRGFGNVMFAYASLLGIAERNGLQAVMPLDVSIYGVFQASIPRVSINLHKLTILSYVTYQRRSGTYDRHTENLISCPVNTIIWLDGFYHSWKYFSSIEDKLKMHFSFLPHIQISAQKYLKSLMPTVLQNTKFVKVGVHVRRGDMLNPRLKKDGFTVADAAYLKRAMDYFRDRYERLLFIVCSNGIKWSKENINGNDVIFSESKDYNIDLAILASCDHTIITVGTFGWWAAWLANGTTIYYKDWPLAGSPLDGRINKTDYFLPHWIPM